MYVTNFPMVKMGENTSQNYEYMPSLLFADFLSANSLIHIGPKWQFFSKKSTFVCEFKTTQILYSQNKPILDDGNKFGVLT